MTVLANQLALSDCINVLTVLSLTSTVSLSRVNEMSI